jgi:prepilin-type N-terminal cleavage/methylation domain-containing protein
LKQNLKHKSSAGFTLIEILVVTAIFTVLMGLGLFMGFNSYLRYNLNSERDIAVGVLERARSRAMNNMFESSHGVHFASSSYTVFRGKSYVVGSSTNEIIPANPAVQHSGLTDIYFEQLTASTTGGTLTLTDGTRSVTTTINHEGTIDW